MIRLYQYNHSLRVAGWNIKINGFPINCIKALYTGLAPAYLGVGWRGGESAWSIEMFLAINKLIQSLECYLIRKFIYSHFKLTICTFISAYTFSGLIKWIVCSHKYTIFEYIYTWMHYAMRYHMYNFEYPFIHIYFEWAYTYVCLYMCLKRTSIITSETCYI